MGDPCPPPPPCDRPHQPLPPASPCLRPHSLSTSSTSPTALHTLTTRPPPLPPPPSAVLDDLHSFDPDTMTWTLLSDSVPVVDDASRPSARSGHGFTSAGGLLYVHGGLSFNGDALSLEALLRVCRCKACVASSGARVGCHLCAWASFDIRSSLTTATLDQWSWLSAAWVGDRGRDCVEAGASEGESKAQPAAANHPVTSSPPVPPSAPVPLSSPLPLTRVLSCILSD